MRREGLSEQSFTCPGIKTNYGQLELNLSIQPRKQSSEEKKHRIGIFANYTSKKVLISRIYKELIKTMKQMAPFKTGLAI